MLGLPYPGGPAISRVAKNGDPKAYQFPRSFIRDRERLDFSFSGLKTAVRYAIAGLGRPDFSKIKLSDRQIADLAASFQAAVVDCLTAKSLLALEKTGLNTLCVGGGVAANQVLRQKLEDGAESVGAKLIIAPLSLCTDNAVMGAIAVEKIKAGLVDDLELDITPGLVRLAGK